MFTGYTATGEFIPDYESFVNTCPTGYPVGNNDDMRSSNDHIKSIVNFLKFYIPISKVVGVTKPPCKEPLKTIHIQPFVIEAFSAIKKYCNEITLLDNTNQVLGEYKGKRPYQIIRNISKKANDDIESLSRLKYIYRGNNTNLSDYLTEMIRCSDKDSFDNNYTANVNNFIEKTSNIPNIEKIHISLTYIVLLARALLYYYTYSINKDLNKRDKAYIELIDIVNKYDGDLDMDNRITVKNTCPPLYK